jgi:hypothetical protein
MLDKGPGKQCFWQVYTKGFVHLGTPIYKEPVAGQEGEEETAASQWPLVRRIYNRAQCIGRGRRQVTNSQETHCQE